MNLPLDFFAFLQNGILSALPYLCGWITAVIFSLIAHKIQKHNFMTPTVQRKAWNSIGRTQEFINICRDVLRVLQLLICSLLLFFFVALWGGACILLILSSTNMNDARIVIPLLILTVAFDSGTYNGFLTNHVDVSPNFCGTLMGITNSLACITSALGPLTVGWIVSDPVSILMYNMFK